MKSKRRFRSKTSPRSTAEHEKNMQDDARAILRRVAEIPCGCVATYSQIAWLAGLPGRARLVGRVLASLPPLLIEVVSEKTSVALPGASPAVSARAQLKAASSVRKDLEIFPWHRVINAQGKLSLPINSAAYLEQRRRLCEEGVLFRKERIDLRRYQWRSLDDSPLLD
jgi:methylated-DNA-protein-cysteine methyltransferase-like protein